MEWIARYEQQQEKKALKNKMNKVRSELVKAIDKNDHIKRDELISLYFTYLAEFEKN
ncbi:hypothetical protein [Photobacterium kishitanii]|uniref:hypothetical protein n=1 Tax=Photobacterium kishitanii TaxID=318456 RepID=UPI0015E671E0|nr:hypothetical protein [Photobacterium kishitanii]